MRIMGDMDKNKPVLRLQNKNEYSNRAQNTEIHCSLVVSNDLIVIV